jgi:hypothetical protein
MSLSAALCEELARRGLARLSAAELEAALRARGLSLTGGARDAVNAHLAAVRGLSADGLAERGA